MLIFKQTLVTIPSSKQNNCEFEISKLSAVTYVSAMSIRLQKKRRIDDYSCDELDVSNY